MRPLPVFADAVDLLDPGEHRALRDDRIDSWQLDLSATSPDFPTPRRSIVHRVAERFAARVAAGHDAKLFLAPGLLNTRWAASLAADAFVEVGQGQTPIAIIRGEDVLGELEAWHADGEELVPVGSDAPLFDLPTQLIAAVAPADETPLRAALEAGARVVVTASSSEGHAKALLPTDGASPPENRRKVLVWTDEGFCVDAVLRFRRSDIREECEGRIKRSAAAHRVDLACDPLDQPGATMKLVVAASGRDKQALQAFADTIHAVAPRFDSITIDGPPPAVRQVTQRRQTDVAAKRVRYAADVRPASEWRDEYPGWSPR